ncbi:MAG: hypothetical protein COA78_20525 [Blastopirellula sp.]|nr:MAG: hypothetical protein COA78_20525 [Blastopirellula sp.]
MTICHHPSQRLKKSRLPVHIAGLLALIMFLCIPCVAQEKPTPSPGRVSQEQGASQEQNVSQEQVDAYIQQLGASSFEAREQAAKELLRLGKVAEQALEKNVRNPNPEIKRRSRSLLAEIKVHNRNLALSQFIDGKSPVDQFPYWARFKSIAGDNALSRKLYHKMASAEWELLTLAENAPEQVDYQFYKRAVQLKTKVYSTTQVHPSLGSISTLLFIASDKRVEITGPAYSELQYLLSAPELSQALHHPDNADAIYKVLNAWVDSCVDNPHLKAENRFIVLLFAIREDLKAGISLAKSVIKSPIPNNFNLQNNVHIIYAVLGIAKLGSKKDIAYLETLLDDQQSVYTYISDNSFETQIRDAALVGILHIKGKDPKKFGFTRLTVDANYLYSHRTIGFASESDRKAAFDHWAADIESETKK